MRLSPDGRSPSLAAGIDHKSQECSYAPAQTRGPHATPGCQLQSVSSLMVDRGTGVTLFCASFSTPKVSGWINESHLKPRPGCSFSCSFGGYENLENKQFKAVSAVLKSVRVHFAPGSNGRSFTLEYS